ncbi:UNVERIFIED_CONTAM: hypothetical protein HDU68_010996 [Siphonaria sp. JEL0065]|nr:hypothetical protein HDU68_010996 [Siphonaria sp. JEL0065]
MSNSGSSNNNTTAAKRKPRKKVHIPIESEPTRRTKLNCKAPYSAAWYVGYADDSESIEAIMKKFEALDELKQEVSVKAAQQQSSPSSDSNPPNSVETQSSTRVTESGSFHNGELGERELEELFRRTSKATVKELTSNASYLQQQIYEEGVGSEGDEFDEEDLYQWNECDKESDTESVAYTYGPEKDK